MTTTPKEAASEFAPDERVRGAAARTLELYSPSALLVFGSCLSPATRRKGSIPDLFAVVEDLDRTLRQAHKSALVRYAARVLPPLTLSLRGDNKQEIAKLNLIDQRTLRNQLVSVPDLYIAGRLSKRSQVLHVEDPRQLRLDLDRATRVVVSYGMLCPPRRLLLEEAVRRCFGLSYQSEIRPETPKKREALYNAFPGWYLQHFGAFVKEVARERGFSIDGDLLIDERPESLRRQEARQLRSLIFRSRLRVLARWPKQALVYQGWFPYLVAKIRRARSN